MTTSCCGLSSGFCDVLVLRFEENYFSLCEPQEHLLRKVEDELGYLEDSVEEVNASPSELVRVFHRTLLVSIWKSYYCFCVK